MRCDRCKRDDDRPHYHEFVEVLSKEGKRPAIHRHIWVCGDCKLGKDAEHCDEG